MARKKTVAVSKEMITVKTSEIITNPKNEKVHNSENLNLIRASLNDIGYLTPIIVDETNMILSGHGRFIVMQEDKVKEIEVMKITGLSESQKNKFRIYDNQSARTGFFDDELLLNTIEGILKDDSSFNVGILGIENMTDLFSDVELSFDIAKQDFSEQKAKTKAIIILSSEMDEVIKILDQNNITYTNALIHEAK